MENWDQQCWLDLTAKVYLETAVEHKPSSFVQIDVELFEPGGALILRMITSGVTTQTESEGEN